MFMLMKIICEFYWSMKDAHFFPAIILQVTILFQLQPEFWATIYIWNMRWDKKKKNDGIVLLARKWDTFKQNKEHHRKEKKKKNPWNICNMNKKKFIKIISVLKFPKKKKKTLKESISVSYADLVNNKHNLLIFHYQMTMI